MKRSRPSARPSFSTLQRAKTTLWAQLLQGVPSSASSPAPAPAPSSSTSSSSTSPPPEAGVHERAAEVKSYLSGVEGELLARLDLAFAQKVSTSLLVLGPVGSGKRQLVEGLLAKYVRPGFGGIAVARVQGQICSSDQQALCSIADQFLLRAGVAHEKNISLVLEDLARHFRQCHADAHPAVVLLQDLHIFAAREKQVLIYTLLDFMHQADMLFVVIGLTPCAHISSLLEKRVLSRLNAQFVYVPSPTGADMADQLAARLSLPDAPLANSSVGSTKKVRSSLDGGTQGSKASTAVDEETSELSEEDYRRCFNKIVADMCSDGTDSNQNTLANNVASLTSTDNGGDTSLRVTLRRLADWGRGLSFVLSAAQLAVSSLTIESPYLSVSAIESALRSQEPSDLLDKLLALPFSEMHLFAATARLHGRKQGLGSTETANANNSGSSSSNSSSSSSSSSSSAGEAASASSADAGSGGGGGGGSKAKRHAKDVTVEEVLREYDLLTSAIRKKEVPEARCVQALLALQSQGLVLLSNGGGKQAPARQVADRSLVLLLPPEYEIRAAFSGREGGGSSGAGPASSSGPGRVLMITERVRRAVLEPLLSLHDTTQSIR